MRPLKRIEAKALPLPLENVDTDQIIPARFMRRTRAEGYGSALLHDLRFTADGALRPETPFADPRLAGAEMLIARRNFGCGSSREAAVYALADYGFRVVIAPSFGDIFAANAVRNGLAPVVVSADDAEALLGAERVAQGLPLIFDLEAQTIICGNLVVPFAIDPLAKTQLLNGWDEIDLTVAEDERISAFEANDAKARPWMAPRDA